jgi:2-keto-4-pentenoate hydratase
MSICESWTLPATEARSVRKAANRLMAAHASGRPCAPVRDLIGPNDVRTAYAVQNLIAESRTAAGHDLVGHKIGLTSQVAREQFGAHEPDSGPLFADMAYVGGDTVPVDAVQQPRVEAEIAFVLKHDLVDGSLDYQQVRDAIDYAAAAIEICGSRIEGWDLSLSDTVADSASSGAFVLGPKRTRLDSFEPRDVAMSLSIDGTEMARGMGANCFGDPLLAVQWLARQKRERGHPLRAGQLILSGALDTMRRVESGQTILATIGALGSVTFTLGNHDVLRSPRPSADRPRGLEEEEANHDN